MVRRVPSCSWRCMPPSPTPANRARCCSRWRGCLPNGACLPACLLSAVGLPFCLLTGCLSSGGQPACLLACWGPAPCSSLPYVFTGWRPLPPVLLPPPLQGGGPFHLYSSDGEMLFKQDSYFFYLFGVRDDGWWEYGREYGGCC